NVHRIVVDAEHAGPCAGRGTQAARPLGEIVGDGEAVDGLAPAVAVHEVVPVGNEVTQRTALVAEGDAAVHAAGALLLELVRLEGEVDLLPVVDALGHGAPLGRLALELDEAGDLPHQAALVVGGGHHGFVDGLSALLGFPDAT